MNFKDLLTLHLPSKAWEKDNCFQSLLDARNEDNLAELFAWLTIRAEHHLAGETRYEYEWRGVLLLTACACLSILDAKEEERLSRILLGQLTDLGVLAKKKFKKISDASLNPVSPPLRRIFENYDWLAPLNHAWAWDAVRQFSGIVDQTCKEEITILLYDNGGELAKLRLEAFPGIHPGVLIFPDPRWMTFVQVSDDFLQSFEKGIEFALLMAESQSCPPIEIRWRITRLDREPLYLLKGQSVGAAFALTLVKLLSQFAPLVKKQNIPVNP